MARVTVVNDYPEFLTIMEELVAREGGHDFCGFDGAETTYQEIASTHPDVLIIDLRMLVDGMSGWDVLALARSDDALRDVPVIICSADMAQLRQRKEDLERIGNIHVRFKPFDSDEMIELIGRLAGQRAKTGDMGDAAAAT
jgi:DNA-binding NtrC family response regulator